MDWPMTNQQTTFLRLHLPKSSHVWMWNYMDHETDYPKVEMSQNSEVYICVRLWLCPSKSKFEVRFQSCLWNFETLPTMSNQTRALILAHYPKNVELQLWPPIRDRSFRKLCLHELVKVEVWSCSLSPIAVCNTAYLPVSSVGRVRDY